MLTYHPALDPYHCAFRLLAICEKLNVKELEVDRIRLYDFYFVFPRELKKVKFPRDFMLLKNSIRIDANHYDQIQNPQRIFDRIGSFQTAALKYLAAYGLIESRGLKENLVSRTNKRIPVKLKGRLDELSYLQTLTLEIFTTVFQQMPLAGNGGLKFRTNLLEFRYDAL